MRVPEYLSAEEAARALGISRATLYAYVSRGLLHSEAQPGPSRARRYRSADVRALQDRQALRRDPQAGVRAATREALSWGEPTLDSALSLIADGALFYRGVNALALAETVTVEEVAALLWTGEREGWRVLTLRARLNRVAPAMAAGLPEAYGAALNHAAAHDLHALEHSPQAAGRVLTLLYAVTERAWGVPPAPDLPLHARLARAWGVAPGGADLLRRALVLCADHELNVSSFAARVVASSGASLHHATLAALCAFQGPRHGLMTARAHALLSEVQRQGPAQALRMATTGNGGLPGFGHPLYPAGDPRAAALLAALPDSEELLLARTLARQVQAELGQHPNLDFALAALAHALGLSAQQALALFALGRTVGWLAHALESMAQGRLLRPRARYTGPAPGTPP